MNIPITQFETLSPVLGTDISRRHLLRSMAAGSLVVAAGGLRPRMRAFASQASPTPEPAYRYKLGTFDVRAIYDGWFAFPAPVFAINAPPQELAVALGETGQSMDRFALDLLVTHIDTGDHQVLIDPGAGLPTPEIGPMLAAMQAEGFAGETGRLLPTLEAEGIAPEDIDTVILTHLHVDHMLGAAGPGGPAFPNARYVISRPEYEYWSAGPSLAEIPGSETFKVFFREGAKATLMALKDSLEVVEPNTEVVPGVKLIPAIGHTPGHMAIEVSSEGETLLHIGDAAADPVLHLEHPDWFIAYVVWPAMEILTRRQLFDRAADENLLVQTVHFTFPGVGRVSKEGDGWLWQPEE